MKNNKPENPKRRGFLLTAGVGGAGVIAAVTTAVGTNSAKPLPAVTGETKTGAYAETEHVNNYYRTARV